MITIDISENTTRDIIHFILGTLVALIVKHGLRGLKIAWKFYKENKDKEMTVTMKYGQLLKVIFGLSLFFVALATGAAFIIKAILG